MRKFTEDGHANTIAATFVIVEYIRLLNDEYIRYLYVDLAINLFLAVQQIPKLSIDFKGNAIAIY